MLRVATAPPEAVPFEHLRLANGEGESGTLRRLAGHDPGDRIGLFLRVVEPTKKPEFKSFVLL